jgi:hypothetical protein
MPNGKLLDQWNMYVCMYVCICVYMYPYIKSKGIFHGPSLIHAEWNEVIQSYLEKICGCDPFLQNKVTAC